MAPQGAREKVALAGFLFILNDPPYGTERSYNALRLAVSLLKKEPKPELRIFLVGDAASCAKRASNRPTGTTTSNGC